MRPHPYLSPLWKALSHCRKSSNSMVPRTQVKTLQLEKRKRRESLLPDEGLCPHLWFLGGRSGSLSKPNFQDTETSACSRLGLNQNNRDSISTLYNHYLASKRQVRGNGSLPLGEWQGDKKRLPLWCRHTEKMRVEMKN